MNIFLAGASGLVGSAFARAAFRRGHRVVGTVGNFTGEIEGLVRKRTVDLANPAATNPTCVATLPWKFCRIQTNAKISATSNIPWSTFTPFRARA
jgi:nucleoside-diphosphate-sugar epimerase